MRRVREDPTKATMTILADDRDGPDGLGMKQPMKDYTETGTPSPSWPTTIHEIPGEKVYTDTRIKRKKTS